MRLINSACHWFISKEFFSEKKFPQGCKKTNRKRKKKLGYLFKTTTTTTKRFNDTLWKIFYHKERTQSGVFGMSAE